MISPRTLKKLREQATWIFMEGSTPKCNRCGATCSFTLPMKVEEFLVVSRGFIDQHLFCKESSKPESAV
jgi:hypothetical protein